MKTVCITRARFGRRAQAAKLDFFSNSKSTWKRCENGINLLKRRGVPHETLLSQQPILICYVKVGVFHIAHDVPLR